MRNEYQTKYQSKYQTKYESDVAIIGAGPCGMFAVFALGMLNIKAILIDALSEMGGQCMALYPEKPIYDIPSHPKITGRDLINNLYKQISPFNPQIVLDTQVNSILRSVDSFELMTDSGSVLSVKSVIISTGCGLMKYRKLNLPNISEYENKTLFYSVKDVNLLKDKKILIVGGGDSAIDWSLNLSEVADHIYLIHRNNIFRAMPHSVDKVHALSSKIQVFTPYTVSSIKGTNGKVQSVEIRDNSGDAVNIEVDVILMFLGFEYGSSSPISVKTREDSALDANDCSFESDLLVQNVVEKDLHLEMQDNRYVVDHSTMLTNIFGIMSIGDVAFYAGKLKLILTGFAEAARAAHTAYGIINPNKPLHHKHSTTKGIPNPS